MRQRCPICGKMIVEPAGNPSSQILIVGEFPGYQENIMGVPFAFRKGPSDTPRAGDILQVELGRAGVSMQSAYLTNLWNHPKDEKECDPKLHLDQLVRLFVDRTHVLLMGSDVTVALLGEKAPSLYGLKVKVPGFRSRPRFWVAPHPTSVFGQPIGEFRLALQRFGEDIKKTK